MFPDNTPSSFTNFLPEQVNLEGQGQVAISEMSYPSMYQSLTEGYFKFFDKELSTSTSSYNLEPGLYTSITDIVEAMNTLIRGRNNHNGACITVKVSRRTQKVVILLANDSSGLACCSTDLGHILITMWETVLRYWWKEKDLMNHNLPTTLFVSIRRWSSRVQHCWRLKNSLATMLSLYLKAKGRRHYNNWTVHELSDIQ